MSLDQGSTIQAEYVWLGGNGHYRCKTKSLETECKTIDDYPIWNFDGSSTNQAPGGNSEVYLKPVAKYPDPFRGGKNIILLCECVLPESDSSMNMVPHDSNTRAAAAKVFNKVANTEPWFGIEQEYTLFYDDGRTPFGWPHNGFPAPQGPFYCSAGTENAFGRRVADAHYRACLYAGIKISGINAEVMAGQWEYQVGPCLGISSGDELHMSRYIMQRVCEDYGVIVSFDPKPIPGDWNGAGCHTNFSTKAMRAEGGYSVIETALGELEKHHALHIQNYGVGNDRRLTGAHETAHIDKFSWGVADRGRSVRVPKTTFLEKKGYFEDRRPASNMDPYIVTKMIAETCILGRD
jgi:glutamine synthetase